MVAIYLPLRYRHPLAYFRKSARRNKMCVLSASQPGPLPSVTINYSRVGLTWRQNFQPRATELEASADHRPATPSGFTGSQLFQHQCYWGGMAASDDHQAAHPLCVHLTCCMHYTVLQSLGWRLIYSIPHTTATITLATAARHGSRNNKTIYDSMQNDWKKKRAVYFDTCGMGESK